MAKHNSRKIIGLGWDDEIFEDHTLIIWNNLRQELQKISNIDLNAFDDQNVFLQKLDEDIKPDFLIVDIYDKKAKDDFGFHLAQTARGKGFTDPIFMISREDNLLLNIRRYVSPPFAVFRKSTDCRDLAFSIFNLLSSVGLTQSKIFIGHGHSHQWLSVRDYIQNNFPLECEEFNSVPVEGMETTSRLEIMKKNAGLAIIVMTAEDEQKDGSYNTRLNIIHEIGYFQGYLGFKKVIILMQDDCNSFTNLGSITYIPFKKTITTCFPKLKKILIREKFIWL